MINEQIAPHFTLAGRIEGQVSLPPTMVWVPTEQVLLTQVKVPGKRTSEWQQALPYVLEESLAQPIEQLHFAVLERQQKGDQAGLTSVAVVEKSLMQAWIAELKVHGWEQAQLVPDCFQLPWAPEENAWSVNGQLVRSGAFSGLAASESLLPHLAQKAGASLKPVDPRSTLSKTEIKSFGLRQGAFQPQAEVNRTWQLWRGSVWAAGLLLALFLGQAVWQTEQTLVQRQALQAQTETLFKQMFPDVKRLVNLRSQTKAKLSGGNSAEKTAGPARLFKQMEAALLPWVQNQQIQLGTLNWNKGQLSLAVTAKETQTLEKARQAMSQLKVELKLKQVQNNQVEASFYVQSN